MGLVAGDLDFLAGGMFRTEVDQHQMVVGAAGNDAEPFVLERLGQHGGILHQLLLISFEFRAHGFLEADRLGCDHMFERTALQAGEHFGVDRLDVFFLAEDEAGTRAAQGLVRGRGHYIAIGNRGRMQSGRHQTGDMRHVNEEIRIGLVGDLAQTGEIDNARISGGAGQDHARLAFHREFFDFVVIDHFGVFVDAVGNDIEEFAGEVHRMAVGQVSAVIQAHGEHRVAGVQQRDMEIPPREFLVRCFGFFVPVFWGMTVLYSWRFRAW